MSKDFDNEDKRTEAIWDWCDKVDSIKIGDDETLPALIKDTDTETLMAVYEHYDVLLSDNQKLGGDEAPFSDWDQEVMSALRAALRERGLIPVSEDIAEMIDEVLDGMPSKTVH